MLVNIGIRMKIILISFIDDVNMYMYYYKLLCLTFHRPSKEEAGDVVIKL